MSYKKRLEDILNQEKKIFIEHGFDKPFITKYMKDRRREIGDKLKSDLLISSTQIYGSMR